MGEHVVSTIRDTPFGACMGAKIIDITADERDEIEDGKSRVYFHFDNGQTIFATIGGAGSELMGMIDMGPDAGLGG